MLVIVKNITNRLLFTVLDRGTDKQTCGTQYGLKFLCWWVA